MADLRTSVAILEDVSTGGGLPLHKALAGDAAAGKNAAPILVAIDPDGNLQYLRQNAQNELIVSSEGDLLQKRAKGSVTGSATFVDVAVVTLTPGAIYKNIGWIAGCYRDAEFKIVQVDDMTTTDVALGILMGSGSEAELLSSLSVTAGASGTQTLKLMAKNQNSLSDFRGTLTADEVQ